MEEVLSDAYNPKTKIPLKILVNKFTTSAYSFKRVTITIIKITSEECRQWKSIIVLHHFLFSLFLLKYLVSYVRHLTIYFDCHSFPYKIQSSSENSTLPIYPLYSIVFFIQPFLQQK